jgi:transcription factor S
MYKFIFLYQFMRVFLKNIIMVISMQRNRTKKFCPKCGSTNIKWFIPQMWSVWECFDCGYIGIIILEDGKLADKIREKYFEEQEK